MSNKVIFKYKNKCSLAYAPGNVLPGQNGKDGKIGKAGNALYFITYNLDNSYYIELALQKIENNYILSNDSEIQLNSRPYQVNDLILSSKGNCYRIIEATSEKSNYKFDIEFLGQLRAGFTNIIKRIVIYNINGLKLVDENGVTLKEYSPVQFSALPTNRCEDHVETRFYNNYETNKDPYAMYGVWLKFAAYKTEKADYSQFTTNLTMYLHNKTTMYEGAAPGTNPMKDMGQYHSKLEFSNVNFAALDDENNPDSITKLFSEITDSTYTFPGFPYAKTSFMSDHTLDRLHPSETGIRCTLSNDKMCWWKTGVKASTAKNADGTPILNPATKKPYNLPNVEIDNYITDLSLHSMVEQQCTSTAKGEWMVDGCEDCNLLYEESWKKHPLLTVDDFPQYAAGGSDSVLSPMTRRDIQRAIERQDYNLLPVATRTSTKIIDGKEVKTEVPINRPGDTFYFSSIPADEVCDAIYSFLTNGKNEFFVTTKDNLTKEYIVSPVTVEFDNETFKDKTYMVSFTEGRTKIAQMQPI